MDIKRVALRSVTYSALGQYYTFILGLIKTIILARLILPQYFGIVALATIWVSFLGIINAFDFKTVVISEKKSEDTFLYTQFILEILLSLIVLIIGIPAFFIFKHFYNNELPIIILILLTTKLISSFYSTPSYMLEKNMEYPKVFKINLYVNGISFIIPVTLAFLGFGIWALVSESVVVALTSLFAFWLFYKWKPLLIFNKEIAKNIMKLCGILWLVAIMGKIMFEFDDWLVGNMVGFAALGFYSKVYNFSKMPMDLVAGPIGVIGLPLFSKINRDEPGNLEFVYHNVTWALVRIIFFFTTLLFVNFHDLTLILLGENWLPMVPIFKFILVYSLLRPLYQNDSQLLLSLRAMKLFRNITIIQALFMLTVCPILVFYIKADGAALASSLMMFLGFLIQNIVVGKKIRLERKKLFLIPLIFLIIFVILMVFLVPKINIVDNILFRILLNSTMVVVAFGILFLLFERRDGRKVVIFLSDIVKERFRKC